MEIGTVAKLTKDQKNDRIARSDGWVQEGDKWLDKEGREAARPDYYAQECLELKRLLLQHHGTWNWHIYMKRMAKFSAAITKEALPELFEKAGDMYGVIWKLWEEGQ